MKSLAIAQYTHELSKLGLTKRLQTAALAVKPQSRRQALEMLQRTWIGYYTTKTLTPAQRAESRKADWIKRQGLELAAQAGYRPDEHGFSSRGDHQRIVVIDYIPPRHSAAAPYFDAGGAGLALIRIDRTRVYARSSKWSPSVATTYYVVGRNEAGTYFGHPVVASTSVAEALDWMWSGYEIVVRQGDIAIARNGKSGYIPDLPVGHRVEGEQIVHATHPAIRLPGRGERIVIARRASARVSRATRD
jgi:hypothetical protein